MIDTIHVVFKTHLDIGFTALARDVISGYTERYLPRAIDLAEELDRRGGPARFVWTTGSWLIDHVLRQGSPAQSERLDAAVRAGWIRWHGLALTTHTELMDPSLAAFAASIAHGLDARYDRRTIAAKMTDVPGHTIGLVPVLAAAGIEYLHLGVNGASAVPDVPEFFVWRAPGGAEVVVNYARSYGSEGLDLAVVPGGSDALHLAHTGDNNGPPTAAEVEELFAALAAAHPGARIVASSLDDFARALLPHREALPVVTEEIGDTWIHGAGADPLLTAGLGVLQRLRTAWLREGLLDPSSAEHHELGVALLRIAEHTWGEDLKTYLPDYVNYAKADFRAARARDLVDPAANPVQTRAYDWAWAEHPSPQGLTYSGFEASWAEQRAHLDTAVSALAPERAIEASAALAALRPAAGSDVEPTVSHFRPHHVPIPAAKQTREEPEVGRGSSLVPDSRTGRPRTVGEEVTLGRFAVRFGADGAIVGLRDERGSVWADAEHTLGSFRHQTFDERDEQRWLQHYCRDLAHTGVWAIPDQASPGLAIAETLPARVTAPEVQGLRTSTGDDGADTAIVELTLPEELVAATGAPARIMVEYLFPQGPGPIRIVLDVCGREASRLPEASWFGFRPAPGDTAADGTWTLQKLGVAVDPRRVVSRGNRTLHAATSADRDGTRPVHIRTIDAPLVAVGAPALLRFEDALPDPADGFAVNLHNNVWGTNFRMWFDDDLRYRFELDLGSAFDPDEETR
ncbi:DUF5054 domain-containing protein [Microbacterium azadirachtae]|uniref:DUF5054 domain-containing protein n=1 Tax=Microbacterium azadirachtae TaxID=582680 RepID=A0A0F0LK27_9MICO|nr:DUF5054 domain-containing protein [Microbacterium azadirachtae]KJL33488.1 hypothetical protein RS86_01709 [Microbacterium azadirachtae]